MKCFLFGHKFICVSVHHYNYITGGAKRRPEPSTVATYVCKVCKEATTKTYYSAGHLTIDELNGDIDTPESYKAEDWK